MYRKAAIICGMVTYCVGSARQKRAYFSGFPNAVVLDNVEVLFCASENGFNYFAYGAIPFGDFTVRDYLRYRRALCGDKVTDDDIRRLGLSPQKRLCRLSAAQLRCVTYLEKCFGKDSSFVVINLDGAVYSRRNAAALKKLLGVCKNAYVCVTDERFVARARGEHRTLHFGKKVKRHRPRFYGAKQLGARLNATRVSVM